MCESVVCMHAVVLPVSCQVMHILHLPCLQLEEERLAFSASHSQQRREASAGAHHYAMKAYSAVGRRL